MILILSDGGEPTVEAAEQLEMRYEEYLIFFTDFVSAGTYGKGSVLVGRPTEEALCDTIQKIRASAVIDAVTEPASAMTRAALSACRKIGIKYVKCAAVRPVDGARLGLSYEQIAEEIKSCRGNTILYAEAAVVSAIARLVGKENADKMYVPVPKAAVFDTATALEYGIPLLNVVECGQVHGADAVSELIARVGAGMLVCDGTKGITDMTGAGAAAEIPVILTHRFGAGLSNVAATAEDAVIAARSEN